MERPDRLKSNLTSMVNLIDKYRELMIEEQKALTDGDIEYADKLNKELDSIYQDYLLYSSDILNIFNN